MASESQRRRPPIPQSSWPDLPPELLERIVGAVGPRDRVAVRLVCASWRACVRERFPSESELPFEAPRLLLRRPGPAGGGLAFFSLRSRKLLPFALPASVAAGRCCGHLAGWLAMAFDAARSLVLCNLVSGRCVAVPPPPVFPVSKVVLSAPPTSPGWVAAALGRTGAVALLQPAVAGAAWMTVGLDEGRQHGGFRDVALWGGRLCALGHDGAVLAFRGDLRSPAAASVLREAEHPLGREDRWQLYLVAESGGEELLLLVRKLYTAAAWNPDAVDVEVEVLALSSAGESKLKPSPQSKWDVVPSSPGRAVVVGSVASAVVPATEGLRESCVYLARREVELLAPHAICEYSLLDGDITGVPIDGGHSADVEPVWITPFV